jgi:hypothetical protein
MKFNCRISILAVLVAVLALGISAQQSPNSELGGVVSLSAPVTGAGAGITVLVPISVNTDSNQLWDHQYDLVYNPAILTPSGGNAGCVTAGAMTGDAGVGVTCFVSPAGRLNLSTASSSFVQGSGTLMFVRFAVTAGTPVGSVSPLNLENALFFDLNGSLAGTTTNGTFTVLGPTAANTSVSGRVLTADGSPVRNARVVFTDLEGESRSAITNPFGYFRVDGLPAGQNYVVSTWAKGHVFEPVSISVVDEISDFEIYSVEK